MSKLFVTICLLVVLLVPVSVFAGGGLPGAIFTTLSDGTRVNQNIYDKAQDVYLDGGPGQNAPSTAAGLPEGDYYFQVTDPPGKVLLSTDRVSCRRFHVNAQGVIDGVIPGSYTLKVGKTITTQTCEHLTGIDVDHVELGAITVQLWPYKKTPNSGGVYKVWVTPVEMFVGNPDSIDNPQYFHGFVPAWSKTDNYKVKGGKACDPRLKVRKFDDSNANGVWDVGEEEIVGWEIGITDPLTVSNSYYTPIDLSAVPQGLWTINEEVPSGWLQTSLSIDNTKQPVTPICQVQFSGLCTQVRTVVYGNIELGSISACKFYDRNGNGIDDSELPVPGIFFTLDGNDVTGKPVHLEDCTKSDGCVTFSNLLPGTYVLCEVLPTGNWAATTEVCQNINLAEGANVSFSFGNICKGYAAFGTKGYWHNKNGLDETVQADIDYLNSLLPWQTASSYFDAGDEPINGKFSDNSPVPAAKNEAGDTIAPAGSALAEQSAFLIDKNAGGDSREQLAQQLDAFIMNIRHRVGIGGFIFVNGNWVDSADLIQDAIAVWSNGTGAQQTSMSSLLDSLNNSSSVEFISVVPCEINY